MDSPYTVYVIVIFAYVFLFIFLILGTTYIKKSSLKKKKIDESLSSEQTVPECKIKETKERDNSIEIEKPLKAIEPSDSNSMMNSPRAKLSTPTIIYHLDSDRTSIKRENGKIEDIAEESTLPNKSLGTRKKLVIQQHHDIPKKNLGKDQKEICQTESIEWPMQSKAISGGYCFVDGPERTFCTTELTYREFNDDFFADDEIKSEKLIRQEKTLIEDPSGVNGSVMKVTFENAPGIHFWANATIEIGGYILKNPLIYTVSDLECLKRKVFAFAWVKERLLLLSDIPADLKYQPHDYEALKKQEFGVNVLNFSVEQKAYYLDWLESCGNDGCWQFKVHCYSRYIDALWYRAFMEQKDLREITLRFFEFSCFESGDRTNIKEMRRALCAYFLAIKQGISFNEEEKKVLAYNFERYFMHYHYQYKSAWNFDPIGFLSSLGHKYLPSAICLLEFYGYNADRWEFCAERDRRHFQYALAATAYIIKNYKFLFKNTGKLSTMYTTRYGFKFSICYYGGISCSDVDLISFIKELCNSTDLLYRITFYGSYLEDFSWESEYAVAFENLPQNIINRTQSDNFPYMDKIKSLLSLQTPSILDVVIAFEPNEEMIGYFKKYGNNRLQLEEEKCFLRRKKKTCTLTLEEENLLSKAKMKSNDLKKNIEQINGKIRVTHYRILVNDFDDNIPLNNVPVVIEKIN